MREVHNMLAPSLSVFSLNGVICAKIKLTDEQYNIGRSEECAIRINREFVSAVHARLMRHTSGHVILVALNCTE